MKCNSPFLTEMSGKLGGSVFGRSKGGVQWVRKLVTPVNPNTLLQTAARGALASASAYWKNFLSEAQQELWWELAEGSQTGQTLFSRVNQPLVYATNSGRTTNRTGTYTANTNTLVLTPPSSMSTPLTPPSGIVIDDSANTLTFTAAADDPWNTDEVAAGEQAILYVYATYQQNASRFSRQRSYQLLAAVVRTDTDLPVGAVTINLNTHGFNTTTGKVMYLKFVAQRRDGSISTKYEERVVITA